MKKLILVMAVLALLCVGGGAMANISAIGDPIDSQSWGQLFNESGVGTFDHLQFLAAPGFTWEAGKQIAVGWTTYISNNGAIMIADGAPATTSLNFMTTWNGNMPLTVVKVATFQTYRGTLMVNSADVYRGNPNLGGGSMGYGFYWAPNTWVTGKITQAGLNPSVPEPMSIMLGIMGLGSVAGFKRLRRS